MALSTPASENALPLDRFTQILNFCTTPAHTDTPALKLARLTSLKLDLRAIQEVEAMEGYATDADFDELLFMPKVQDFLAQTHHDELAVKSFWLLIRMHFLGSLNGFQRAQMIQYNARVLCKPALLLAEFYKLPDMQARLRLLSRLSYWDFAVFIAETDQRTLPLSAESGVFLSSIAYNKKDREARRSARRMFIAR
ncbi:MAG: hypothetical protein JST84_28835 [Acidobacteria bacterium]|nr:hypothetical protein [Acidobacteriota bacterium]